MRICRVIAALACLALTDLVRAELEFEKERIVLNPPIGAEDAVAEFHFVNSGSTPVRLVDVRASCGCTATAPDKNLILPGGKGSVRAVFHIGQRQGRNNVAISVSTDEGLAKTYALSLDVNVAVPVTVTPRFLHWSIGGELSAKTLRISFMDGVEFAGVESLNPDFSVEVLDQRDRVVSLSVVPKDLWAKRNGIIRLRFTHGDRSPFEVTVVVRVS